MKGRGDLPVCFANESIINSSRFSGAAIFNKLPNALKQAKSLRIFKRSKGYYNFNIFFKKIGQFLNLLYAFLYLLYNLLIYCNLLKLVTSNVYTGPLWIAASLLNGHPVLNKGHHTIPNTLEDYGGLSQVLKLKELAYVN